MAQPRSGPKSFKESVRKAPASTRAAVSKAGSAANAAPTPTSGQVMAPRAPQREAPQASGLIRSPRQKEQLVRDMLQGGTLADMPDYRLQIFAKALGVTELPEVGGRQERRDKTLALVQAALGEYEQERQGLRDAREAWSTPAPESETPSNNGE